MLKNGVEDRVGVVRCEGETHSLDLLIKRAAVGETHSGAAAESTECNDQLNSQPKRIFSKDGVHVESQQVLCNGVK